MNKLTDSPDFIIRVPENAEEIERYFRLNAQAFQRGVDLMLIASNTRRFIVQDPDFQLHHLRGAYNGKTQVGVMV